MRDDDDETNPITPEQRIAALRALHTPLKFWIACPLRRCRRYRRCAGDPDRLWPVLPADARAFVAAMAKARNAGRSERHARRIADAAALRIRSLQALGDKV